MKISRVLCDLCDFKVVTVAQLFAYFVRSSEDSTWITWRVCFC